MKYEAKKIARPKAAAPIDPTNPSSASARTRGGVAPSTNGNRPPSGVFRRSDHEPTRIGSAMAISPSKPISAPITVVDAANEDARTGR